MELAETLGCTISWMGYCTIQISLALLQLFCDARKQAPVRAPPSATAPTARRTLARRSSTSAPIARTTRAMSCTSGCTAKPCATRADVFYVLVVRADLGYPVRTQQMSETATPWRCRAPHHQSSTTR